MTELLERSAFGSFSSKPSHVALCAAFEGVRPCSSEEKGSSQNVLRVARDALVLGLQKECAGCFLFR